MPRSASQSNPDQRSPKDTEQLASPSISQGASEEDAPNEPSKCDGADASELFASQPGPSAKIHPERSQEYRHEIYRNSETRHRGIAVSEGISRIARFFMRLFPMRAGPAERRPKSWLVRFHGQRMFKNESGGT